MSDSSRRSFLRVSAGLTAGLFAGNSISWAMAPAGSVRDLKVISLDPYYHGWPTVTRRSNGDLICVCSGGRESHVCPFGRVEMIVSHDEETISFKDFMLF